MADKSISQMIKDRVMDLADAVSILCALIAIWATYDALHRASVEELPPVVVAGILMPVAVLLIIPHVLATALHRLLNR